jgi:orotate phosphoribosyltransferase-like protein
MKTLLFNHHRGLGYPVGSDMQSAIIIANKIVEVFNTIEEFHDKRINVWCRGSSGMILGSLFVAGLKNHGTAVLCHVRKPGEKSHCDGTQCHSQTLFGQGEGPFINVVIDDFISSGQTIKQIQHTMIQESSRNFDVVCLTDTHHHYEMDFSTFFKHVPQYYIHCDRR